MSNLFRGRTKIEAYAAARQALGDGFETATERRVKREGLAGMLGATDIEIEARLRAKPTIDAVLPEPDEPDERRPFAARVYDLDEDDGERGASDIDDLKRDVRMLQSMLRRISKQTQPWREELTMLRRSIDANTPPLTGPIRLKRLIESSGIDGPMARSLIRSLGKPPENHAELVDMYRDALANRVAVGRWPLAGEGPSVVALVGPAGVGKTTTAAKLAARALAAKKTVAFIAGDTYRVAAIEQLARYAELLDIPIHVAANSADLHQHVSHSDADLVIVDTAGREPTEDDCVDLGLADPQGWQMRKRNVLLCLPASMRAADLEFIIDQHRKTLPTAICVTKLDLTSSPGALALAPSITNLPITTLCNGQQVPEDIAPATAGAILDYLAPRVSE
jgi:flagellar biosynthesis protein FlhF